MTVLLVEKIRSTATSHIADDRWLVACAEDADEAMLLLGHETYDLVLLNMGAQPSDGFGLIRRMRASKDDTPILALTGSRADDRLEALRLGADEALAEPVDPAELRALVTSVLRRGKSFSQSLLRLGDLSLCLATREVRFGDKPVRLTLKEFAMLELMGRRKGTVLTKTMFLNHLYNDADDEPEAMIIDVFICKLRKKLERAGGGNLITTVWGRGYMIPDLDPLIRTARDIALSVARPESATGVDPQQIQLRPGFSSF